MPHPTRRSLLAAASAGVALASCAQGGTTSGGPSGEATPPAQLKKGVTIQVGIDAGATRTPPREEQLKLFTSQFPDLNVAQIATVVSIEMLSSCSRSTDGVRAFGSPA